MDLITVDDPAEAGVVMADIVCEAVDSGIRYLGLATGSSPLPAYRELIARHRAGRVSFAGTQAYLLDEYVGLPAGHPQSYAQVIRDEFTDHIDIDAVHGPDGTAADPAQAAQAYDAELCAIGGVDLQILGIGANGHIAFNEPSSPLTSRTRPATLTEQTRADNARFFDHPDDVPRLVITQGLATISSAAHLLLVATGTHKARAIADAVAGPVSPACPASVLQAHPHATVVVDTAAAGMLLHH
ncbi:glucosamine-6-phosphate deaminase [Williamsia sp. CHRR-6]|uniref:glucosamine-6-phosphate deaminase n=1 Tax=Williamsia sp. CHRR-6 TaxID=2835871 RepID=UPI001BDB0558|nr:glucosamine-6-phosphate deaminase [Williamsia sp. CHRR-6]MBT0568546.1 glucosamine-6-phosphate deaminase [Williamsia sp. CHRR-6]